MCSVWHVWRRHACSALARKAERKRSLVRPKCKLQENIEMYVKEMMEGGGAHSSGSRQGHVGGGDYEHENKHTIFKKCREFD